MYHSSQVDSSPPKSKPSSKPPSPKNLKMPPTTHPIAHNSQNNSHESSVPKPKVQLISSRTQNATIQARSASDFRRTQESGPTTSIQIFVGSQLRQLGFLHIHQLKSFLYRNGVWHIFWMIRPDLTLTLLFIPTNELHPESLACCPATHLLPRQRQTR